MTEWRIPEWLLGGWASSPEEFVSVVSIAFQYLGLYLCESDLLYMRFDCKHRPIVVKPGADSLHFRRLPGITLTYVRFNV